MITYCVRADVKIINARSCQVISSRSVVTHYVVPAFGRGPGLLLLKGMPTVCVDWRRNAACACARSHFFAILSALSYARSTSARDGLDAGV